VFLVVYDGLFPTGDFVLTSTFADGSQETRRCVRGLKAGRGEVRQPGQISPLDGLRENPRVGRWQHL
jgi:hypothetical protein